MKRTYSKPALFKEAFEPDDQLATTLNCTIITRTSSLALQCNYEPDGLGYYIFAEGWTSCVDSQIEDGNVIYCYHAGVNNLFNS